uniref:Endonuclease/exonuclease/phosphatase domain-containing protein n=1 Tax=Aegilops tauschii subsp. strangulata TaxID=200361 RepID=A0A453D6F8_AEGTS
MGVRAGEGGLASDLFLWRGQPELATTNMGYYGTFKGESTLPWMCIGDFNEVLRREEQMGPNERDVSQMTGFREAIDLCGLDDLGYIGVAWTFEKKVAGGQYCRVRLDCALATASWSTLHPFATVRHLVAAKSDHSPIVLCTDQDAASRRIAVDRPFRFETMWERHEDFFPMIDNFWKNDSHNESVASMKEKLDRLASALAGWGSHTFGNVRSELRSLKRRLGEMRSEAGRLGPSHEELKIQERIAELNYREEILWRQRSRVQWLAEGDGNTQFFHQKANMRRRKNRIEQLTRDDGTVCNDENEVGCMVTNFYKNL